MKRKLLLFLLISIMIVLGACTAKDQNTEKTGTETEANETTNKDTDTKESDSVDDASKEEETKEEESKPAENKEPAVETLGSEAFDELLSQLPVTVIKTDYVIQDEKYKALYPDVLQAVIQNNTEEDIKSAVVAFVAWDKNNLPVKIKGQFSFDDGSYVMKVNYDDINLAAGSTYGENSGLQLDESTLAIETSKAIVVSYETFEGTTWENPYFDAFTTLYGEKKLDPNATVEVKIVENVSNTDSKKAKAENKKEDKDLPSEKELEELLKKEPVFVESTKYVVQDEQYKAIYPDVLQAILKNNSKEDIKNAIVAFVAWDKNGLPVKIKGSIDFSDGSYVREANYSDINLAAGKTFGENSGLEIADSLNIKTFKAIVVSYETFEGTKWENPHYDTFRSLYEGKKQEK